MTQQQWQQAWELIGECQDLPAKEREAVFVSRPVDAEVAEHVRGVLAGEEESELSEEIPSAEDSYGPYRPLRLLGEGAMGRVYLAQQETPLQRTVALKIIQPGFGRKEVLERFQIERRVLALMDHPCIARVLDAGRTPRGTPYFVMEYVPGVSITKYCEQQQTPLEKKLELIIAACEAIQHAHQKGIVHRDIKASNVLVSHLDGRPMLKIIDFGIARAMEGVGLDTLSTNFGSLVGTPTHMSPEQTEPDSTRVDTRSDVYSLGVLTYELLTGSTPLRSGSISGGLSDLPELLRRIRTEDPEPPSRRAPVLARQLACELDWIVMRALEKDPARRYQSAIGMAEDLQRYLQGEPVFAGPPTATYRFKKLAKRHQRWLVTAAAFAVVLILASIVAIQQGMRATSAGRQAIASRDRAIRSEAEALASRDEARTAEKSSREERDRAIAAERRSDLERDKALAERHRADRQATTTRAVTNFLQYDLLQVANPAVQADRGMTTPTRDLLVREALDRAAAGIGNRFQNAAEADAEIRHTMGTTYYNLGILPKAKEQLVAAYNLRKNKLGPLHPAALETQHILGKVLRAAGQSAEAVDVFSRVVEGYKKSFGPEDRRTLAAMHSVAVAMRSAGRPKEASALHEKVLEVRKRVFGLEDPDTMWSLNDLGITYMYSGQASLGVPMTGQAFQLRSKVLGPEHPDTVVTMQAYGMILFSTGQAEKALPILLRAVELNERLRGRDHTVTLDNNGSAGNAYSNLYRYEEAIKYFTIAADGYSRLFGEKHTAGVTWRMNIAAAYMDGGRFQEAIPILRAYIPKWIQARGKDDERVQHAVYLLAKNLLWSGSHDEALEIGLPLLADRIRQNGAGHSAIVSLSEVVAQAHVRKNQLPEAEAVYRRVIEARRAAKAGVTGLEAGRAAVWLRQQRWSDAETLARAALPKDGAEASWDGSYLRGLTGAAMANQGRHGEAEPFLLAAHAAMTALRSQTRAAELYKMDDVRSWIVGLYKGQGKVELAAQWTARP